jgi:hypothetical protein
MNTRSTDTKAWLIFFGIADLGADDFPKILQPFVESFARTPEQKSLASPLNRLLNMRADQVPVVKADDDAIVPIPQSQTLQPRVKTIPHAPYVEFDELRSGGQQLPLPII